MTYAAVASPSHATRLDWFAQRAGKTTNYPAPLPDGSFLVSRPKGIFKPADLAYALSVRINLDSPYPDGDVRRRPDGSWYFAYHQENADPSERDREYTNRGLMACIADAVPVGVLRERRVPRGARTEYDVLGLAVPVEWRDGYFFFESIVGPSGARGDTATEVLTAEAEEALEAEQLSSPPPADDYDARRRVHRAIVARRGQAGFRRKLLEAYGTLCAVTGPSAAPVLEAAHLRPYRGPASNVVSNGLLLRADVHTLLDLHLLAIEPVTRAIVVSKTLAGTDYAALAGQPLKQPRRPEQLPATDALQTVFDAFVSAERIR